MSTENLNEQAELTSDEFALLELTNDVSADEVQPGVESPGLLVLTTKSAYVWAIAIVQMFEANKGIEETVFVAALQSAVGKHRDGIKSYYGDLNVFRPPFDENIFRDILSSTSERLNVTIDLDRAEQRAQRAYQALIDKGLIEDPTEIIVYGVSLAVLGLVPTGFSITTEKGRRTKVEYRSILFDYEMRKEGGKRTTSFNFRLYKLLQVFARSFVPAFRDMFKEMFEETGEQKHKEP